MDNQRDQSIEGGNGSSIVYSRALDAEFFGVTVDALASSAFQEWFVLTGLSRRVREEEGATRAERPRASGMSGAKRGSHAQTDGTQRHPIRINDGWGVRIERNGGDPAMSSRCIRDRPCIRGGISSYMRWKLVEGRSSLAVQWLEGGHIPFMEGLSVFSEDNIAVVRGGCSGHTGARAPEEFLLLFRGAIGECFVRTARDAEPALRIANQPLGFVRAVFDRGTVVLFFHPGRERFDIEGNDLTQSGDLVVQGVDGAGEERGKQATIETT
jgi:hypothetical protein